MAAASEGGLGAVRRRKQKHVVLRALAAAEPHELSLAADGRQREAVRDRLAERRQVGHHAVVLLRAADVPAKPGDHLVEHEHGAVLATERLEPLRGNPGDGSLDARRLEEDGGDPPRVLREERSHAREVVVPEAQCLACATSLGMPPSIVVVQMNQSSYEKNGCSAADGDEIAARVLAGQLERPRVSAVEPSFVNFTMSAPVDDLEEPLGALELGDRGSREVRAERQRLRGPPPRRADKRARA